MSAKRQMRVGIVGAGVMAEAMIAGLMADRAVAPGALVASHPRRDRREALAERYGIRVVNLTRNIVVRSEHELGSGVTRGHTVDVGADATPTPPAT